MDEQAKKAILNAVITIQVASDMLRKASEELDEAADGMKAIFLKAMEANDASNRGTHSGET